MIVKCDECARRAATVSVHDTPEDLVADTPYANVCMWCAVALLAVDVCDAEGRR